MSLVLNSSGGGSVTISEPVTAANFTQTIPAATGTFALTSDVIGVGQTWTTFTVGTQRVSGTTYTNTTSKAIVLAVTIGGGSAAIVIGGVTILPSSSTTQVLQTTIIPPGQTYVVTNSAIQAWLELR